MKTRELILTIIICAFVVTGCNKSIAETEPASVDNTLVSDDGEDYEHCQLLINCKKKDEGIYTISRYEIENDIVQKTDIVEVEDLFIDV